MDRLGNRSSAKWYEPLLPGNPKQKQVGPDRIAQKVSCQIGCVGQKRVTFGHSSLKPLAHVFPRQAEITVAHEGASHHFIGVGDDVAIRVQQHHCTFACTG